MAKDDSKITNKEYGRKPYISENYDDLMRKTTNKSMWNQELSKQSEFEKPYDKGDYNDMQHDWPDFPGIGTGDPSWDFPWNTGDPVPDATINPDSGVTVSACCMLTDDLGSMTVKQGQEYKVYMHEWCWSHDIRGVRLIDDPIVDWEVSDNATITEQSNAECKVKVKSDAKQGDMVMLKATTRSGRTCSDDKWIEGTECGCGTIAISYTTDAMSVNEQQTLGVVGIPEGSGCYYTWVVESGGGSVSPDSGSSTTYTAPSSNENCALNPTIVLSIHSANGTPIACDSLDITINEWTGTDEAGYLAIPRCVPEYVGYHYCICSRDTQYIDCNGEETRTVRGHCTIGCSWVGPYCWVRCGENWPECGNDSACEVACGYSGNWSDIRTSEMKAGGCCPPQLM